jgi:hypothetical protein
VAARRLAVAAWRVYPTTLAASAMTTLLAEQQQDGMLLLAARHRHAEQRHAKGRALHGTKVPGDALARSSGQKPARRRLETGGMSVAMTSAGAAYSAV